MCIFTMLSLANPHIYVNSRPCLVLIIDGKTKLYEEFVGRDFILYVYKDKVLKLRCLGVSSSLKTLACSLI